MLNKNEGHNVYAAKSGFFVRYGRRGDDIEPLRLAGLECVHDSDTTNPRDHKIRLWPQGRKTTPLLVEVVCPYPVPLTQS